MESSITTNRPEGNPEFVSNQADIIENQSEDTSSGIQQVAPTENQELNQESAVDEIANSLDEREVSNETEEEGQDADEMAVMNEEKGHQTPIEEVNLEEEDSEDVTGYISERSESAPQSVSKEAIKEHVKKYMGKAMGALSLLPPEEAEGFFKTLLSPYVALLSPYVALLSPYVAYQSPSDSDEDKLNTQKQLGDDDIKNDNHQRKSSNTTNLAAQPEVQSVVNSKLSSASNKSTSSTYVQPNTNNVKINNNSYNPQSKPLNTPKPPQPKDDLPGYMEF